MTAAVIAALGGLYATSGQADHEDEEVVLAFTTMRGNLPNVDINNNIGGFAPWVIRDGDGVLTTEGHVRIRIRGLLFAPGVPNLGGTNPFKTFRAIVSCTTVNAQGETEVVNISTGAFPADAHGDCNIHDKVTLPNPCYAPIILVGPEGKVATPPDTAITGGIWLAATGF
ncbi:MAG TPA: hypothetical protein VKU82_00260 [Planctomycetaceae bacterium]|nr:hypothetical protein [Planctomycetaceae bacterium]